MMYPVDANNSLSDLVNTVSTRRPDQAGWVQPNQLDTYHEFLSYSYGELQELMDQQHSDQIQTPERRGGDGLNDDSQYYGNEEDGN